MKQKERLMGVVMAIIISASMGALASFLVIKLNPNVVHALPVPILFMTYIALSVFVGVICALLLPFGKMGRNLAAKAGVNPPSLKFTIINTIPLSIGNTLILGLFMSLYGVGMARRNAPPEVIANVMPPFVIMWLANYAKLLLPTFVLSYILSVIISPIVSKKLGLTAEALKALEAESDNN